MTPIFCCGFECGVSGSHFTINGSCSYNTAGSFVRNGLRSFRANPVGNTAYFQNSANVVLSSQIFVSRFYIYFTTLPNIDCILYATQFLSNFSGVMFKSSNNSIYAGTETGGTISIGATGVVVTTGIWYLIDCKTNTSANPWLIDVQVNGTTCGQRSSAIALETQNQLYVGVIDSLPTCDFYIDDLIISNTSADYPIGAGKVLSFVPNADGTHTCTTTTIVKGTIAAPTGGGNVAGSTDTFNWVNGRPLLGGATDNTRLVNQQTNASTLYAEVAFEDTTETSPPRAVEVITADRQAATTVGDMTVKLNDNGTVSTIVNRLAAAGVVTDRYTTKQYATPPTGGAWNIAASGSGSFQNIRARFGYSPDALPDQYWRGIMIEAEFVERIPNKIVQVKQAVNRANTY